MESALWVAVAVGRRDQFYVLRDIFTLPTPYGPSDLYGKEGEPMHSLLVVSPCNLELINTTINHSTTSC
jgi:hypothetical protein